MKIQKSLRHESHQIKEFEQLSAFSYNLYRRFIFSYKNNKEDPLNLKFPFLKYIHICD
jgi:hypothetical protein